MIRTRRLPVFLLPVLILACSDSSSPTDPRRPDEPDIDPAALASCSQVSQAYHSELAFIQFCARASECGQPLERTSCGCTRNLVARRDADTTRFYRILDRSEELECILPGQISICDCPAVDGFACIANRCNWNYL